MRATTAWFMVVSKPNSRRPDARHPRRPSPTGAWSPILGNQDRGQQRAERSVSGQRKHRELAAERCVVPQGSIATNGAQAGGGIRQPGGKTDTRPAADAGQNRDVLLATVLIGRHVSDDAGRRLELVEFLAGLGVDGLQIAFERAV